MSKERVPLADEDFEDKLLSLPLLKRTPSCIISREECGLEVAGKSKITIDKS